MDDSIETSRLNIRTMISCKPALIIGNTKEFNMRVILLLCNEYRQGKEKEERETERERKRERREIERERGRERDR